MALTTRSPRHAAAVLLLSVASGIAPGAATAFEPGVTIETVVEDFVVTSITINCPQGEGYPAFQWRMGDHEPGYNETMERLITKIESRYGGWIREHTKVKDGVTESDLKRFKTRAGADSRAGRELCDYLAGYM